jgi:hypothetical protein
MILLFNVKITNQRLGSLPNRGILPKEHNRMDICKYSLTSYLSLDPLVSKYLIYIDLATTEYANQEKELEEYIRKILPSEKLILNFYRNNTQADWQKTFNEVIDPIDDNVIMNITNDDHIFISPNLNVIEEGIDMIKNHADWSAQLTYSHWPEQTRMAHEWDWKYSDNYACGIHRSLESVDICRKERWQYYWFSQDLGEHSDYFRPEMLHHRTSMFPKGNIMYIPLIEQVRHFDGYEHAGNCLNTAPPIEIPDGFFNNQICIAYGYSENKSGFVNIDPSRKDLRAVDINGADYKWALEDIPMFWKDRIVEMDINPNADLELLRENRDYHFYNVANSTIHRFKKLPSSPRLFKNHYLSKKFKNL